MALQDKLQLLQEEWQSLSENFAAIKAQMQRVRDLLTSEIRQQRETSIAQAIENSAGDWCGITFRPDAFERLFERIDEFKSVTMKAAPKPDQDAPVYLFLGETGRRKMDQYLHGQIAESELSRIN